MTNKQDIVKELSNATAIDRGALQLAINVLKRGSVNHQEIAEDLEKACIDLEPVKELLEKAGNAPERVGTVRKYICWYDGAGNYRGILFPNEDAYTHSHVWDALKQLKVYTSPDRWAKPLRRNSGVEVIGAGFYNPKTHTCYGESYTLGVSSNGEDDLRILFSDKLL